MPQRRFQYSLRALIIATLLASFGLGWCAWQQQKAARARDAVKAIQDLGGRVDFLSDDALPARRGPFLQWLLGDDHDQRVRIVVVSGPAIRDTDLARLLEFPHLKELSLRRASITNDGLRHIARLPELRALILSQSPIGDDGLRHLAVLKELRELHLDFTNVRGDGLAHLSGCSHLEVLDLNGCALDADLKPAELASLQQLWLVESVFSVERAKAWSDALPECHIWTSSGRWHREGLQLRR